MSLLAVQCLKQGWVQFHFDQILPFHCSGKIIHAPSHRTIQKENFTIAVWRQHVLYVLWWNYFILIFFLAPAEVLDLTVTNDDSSDALKVKWRRPSGNLDFYNITLSHLGSVKEVKTLQPPVTETHFDKLTPGRLYQVTARTISGELFTDQMATGRTCKSSSASVGPL